MTGQGLSYPWLGLALLGMLLPSESNAQTIEHPTGESDPMQLCVSAHAIARKSAEEHSPYFARAELRQCVVEGCPIAIRAECAEWLTQAELQVPTLVLRASAERGDVEQVQVDIDGERFADSLDGRPLEATPGTHTIAFALPDGRRQELRIVVGLGEKNRVVLAQFTHVESRAPIPRGSTNLLSLARNEQMPDLKPTRNPAWLFGALSLGSAMAAASFLYVGYSKYDTAKEYCSPNCSASEVRKVKRWFILCDVAGATALVAAGVGLYFYFTAEGASASSEAQLGYRGAF